MRLKPWLPIAAAALIAAFTGTSTNAAESIKIGDINSYKRLPGHTIPYRHGVNLAVEHINAKGGVLNGQKLEIISRDDQGKPGEAVKIAEELFRRDGVVMISGSLFSHVGLALTSYAGQKKRLYLAAEPLADALVWAKGNRYTFRLRPSTYMQASMLAQAAAKSGTIRWATIAPNYAYGKDAVAAFKKILTRLNPKVEFVTEQWPGLFLRGSCVVVISPTTKHAGCRRKAMNWAAQRFGHLRRLAGNKTAIAGRCNHIVITENCFPAHQNLNWPARDLPPFIGGIIHIIMQHVDRHGAR